MEAGVGGQTGGDEVVVSEGTYTGRNNVDLRFYGKAITLRSESGPENTIIDGQEYEWRLGDGTELIFEQQLGENIMIIFTRDKPGAFGHAVDICGTIERL